MKRATVTETTWASFTRKEAHRETVTTYETAVKYAKSVADRYRGQGYTVVENADCTYFTAVHGATTVGLKVTPL